MRIAQPFNLDQLQDELRAAGFTVVALTAVDDYVLEDLGGGDRNALPPEAQAVIDVHVAQAIVDPRAAKIDGMSLSSADKAVLKDGLGFGA
jgi:hypothetical protein